MELRIPRASLPVGMYILNITEENTGKSEKIIFPVDKGANNKIHQTLYK